MGKVATLCHIEKQMMSIFRNAFDQQRMVPNTFVFSNLGEVTERSDVKGEAVPALGSGSSSTPCSCRARLQTEQRTDQ